MAKLIILYARPHDASAFEEYYAKRHIPYASKHMPGVIGAENLRVLGTFDGEPASVYRISQLSYASLDDLHAGLASEDSKSVIADLGNFATGGTTLLITDE